MDLYNCMGILGDIEVHIIYMGILVYMFVCPHFPYIFYAVCMDRFCELFENTFLNKLLF